MILNGIVLTTRPKKSGHAYETVWNKERNEAPLITITRSQAERLGGRLAGDGIMVDWAMRYGEPSIGERLKALKARGLRPHPRRPALSAICRRDDGDRQ